METPKWRRSPRESAWTQVNGRGSSPPGLIIENHGAQLLFLRHPLTHVNMSVIQDLAFPLHWKFNLPSTEALVL